MEIMYLLSDDSLKKIDSSVKQRYENLCLQYLDECCEELKILDAIILTDSYETYANYCNENYETFFLEKNFQTYTGCITYFNNFKNAVLTIFIHNIDEYELLEQRFVHEFSHLLFHHNIFSNGLVYNGSLPNRFLDELHSYICEYLYLINFGKIDNVLHTIKREYEHLNIKKKNSEHFLGNRGTLYPIVKIMASLYLINSLDKTIYFKMKRDFISIMGKEMANDLISIVIDLKRFNFKNFSEIEYQNAIQSLSKLSGMKDGEE